MSKVKIRYAKKILRRFKAGLTAAMTLAAGYFLGTFAISYAEDIDVFQLRSIEVRGNSILPRSELVDVMAIPVTGSIFGVDLAEVQRRLETINYVYGVRVGRLLPHTIFVDVVENEPLAYVAGPEFYVVTAEGRALPLPHGRHELELPTLSGVPSNIEALDAGHIEGHSQLEQACAILGFLRSGYPQLYGELSEMVFGGSGEVSLYLAESSTVVRLGDEDIKNRIAALDAFLLTVSGKRGLVDYAYIDLRYNQQIVVRERA
ncbi:MAG: FtsQ-type POTRA domain-containing protein [Candidatus Marinimicrobia bacterium]|nr:FtsQ-type POTRA domain-containing protein [Candidatus Neomarinimicrobiota bacterium]